ncbi:hypothetical protein BS78_10G047900 [Paspalum vaginatum]|nr:hypothetical protein BS78_10G047900 [Paspalum vaginatum]
MGRILHDLPAYTAVGSFVNDRVGVEDVEAAIREMDLIDAVSEAGLPCPNPPLVGVAADELTGSDHAAVGVLSGLTQAATEGTQVAELGSLPAPSPGTSSPPPAPPSQEVDRFFCTPSPPLLQQAPPMRQQRRRKTYDMANVRRSVRLASRSAMPAMRRAEINLSRRLGSLAWSNERRQPTLVKLDRAFCNQSWDLSFESHGLQALATSISDHCPLLLSSLAGPRRPRPFRFENFWTLIPGFLEEVKKLGPHLRAARTLYRRFTLSGLLLLSI